METDQKGIFGKITIDNKDYNGSWNLKMIEMNHLFEYQETSHRGYRGGVYRTVVDI